MRSVCKAKAGGRALGARALQPKACLRYVAEVLILHHPTTIGPNYQPVVHCLTIRQARPPPPGGAPCDTQSSFNAGACVEDKVRHYCLEAHGRRRARSWGRSSS